MSAGEVSMKGAIKTGFGFGLTSGIITTLGLIVGLHAGTQSLRAVVGGIVMIAVADACSDALGIHVAEESRHPDQTREIWEATAAAFVSKFVVAVTFLVPLLLLSLAPAIVAAVLWGLFLLAAFSGFLAHEQGVPAWKVAGEHVGIAVVVIVIAHYVGIGIATVLPS